MFGSERTIQTLIDEIRTAATDFDADVSTLAGRKIIAAMAYKVSQSKTVIDKAGKSLTDEWFKKKKVVDAGRRFARDSLDALRDEIRLPLTEWENEEKRILAEAALKAEMEADEIEAHERNDFLDRETRVLALEAKLEEERLERERQDAQEREERERKARDERMQQEAEEKARRDAAEDLERERTRAETAERARIDDNARAGREMGYAKEKAEQDKKEAIEREKSAAKRRADLIERERLRHEEDNQREAFARAADRENRRTVNRAIVHDLVGGGVSKSAATKAVTLIASGKVRSISIRY